MTTVKSAVSTQLGLPADFIERDHVVKLSPRSICQFASPGVRDGKSSFFGPARKVKAERSCLIRISATTVHFIRSLLVLLILTVPALVS